MSLSATLNWNDEALQSQYEQGLRDFVRKGLVYRQDAPKTLKVLPNAAIFINHRLSRLETGSKPKEPSLKPSTSSTRISKKSSNSAKTSNYVPSRFSSSTVTRTSSMSTDTPMDLDATRSRRFSFRLYCQKSGHVARGCPAKATARLQTTFEDPEGTSHRQMLDFDDAEDDLSESSVQEN